MEKLSYATYVKLIKATRKCLKGGIAMSEVIDIGTRVARKVEEGKIALDPAGLIQDLIYSIAIERIAEDREARRIGEEGHLKNLYDSVQETLKTKIHKDPK